ncbi:hypothetical protein ACIQ4I_11615 [Rummeliibacillus sp. NPDC094406]|uniref:hypothetical protein n=1 Tax=Rummeliibacillus sp. NPDC094406 TaxID=3364511 RepID=UPI00382EE2EE
MRMWRYKFVPLMFIFFGISECSNIPGEQLPPNISVEIENQTIDASRGGYKWETKSLFSNTGVIADAADPIRIGEGLIAQSVVPNSTAIVKYSDGSNPTIIANLWEGQNQTKTLPVKDSEITLPSDKGRHVIEIYTEWKNGRTSYTFVVEVK